MTSPELFFLGQDGSVAIERAKVGEALSFGKCLARGGRITTRWLVNGVVVPGESSPNFLLSPRATLDHHGMIVQCVLSNPWGEVVSRPSVVVIDDERIAPRLVGPLQDLQIEFDDFDSMDCPFEGNGLRFSWFVNGVRLEGIEDSWLSIENTSGPGTYVVRCEASNLGGRISSNATQVRLLGPGEPVVRSTPQGLRKVTLWARSALSSLHESCASRVTGASRFRLG